MTTGSSVSSAFIVANLCFGAASVFNDAMLCLISDEEERDRVSSTGWAYGYAGGGLLLALNFLLVTILPFGLSEGMAVRISLLSAAVWWAGFTFIPFLGLKNRPPAHVVPESGGLLQQSFGQLWATLKSLRQYPVALTFLVAYLFFNDGIQTVIASASIYGVEGARASSTGTVLATYLVVQFVAVFGAVGFGRAAGRYGAKSVILAGLVVWMGIVTVALFVPRASDRALHAPCRRDRHRPGRHPGALALLLQPADPPRQGGGVLQLLPRDGAWHELVRDAGLRAGLPAHRLLPSGDLRAHHVLRRRWRGAPQGGHGEGDQRRGQRPAPTVRRETPQV